MRVSRFRAVTLVEVLVVIAIISIVLALIIPAIYEARNHARTYTDDPVFVKMMDDPELFRFADINSFFDDGKIDYEEFKRLNLYKKREELRRKFR